MCPGVPLSLVINTLFQNAIFFRFFLNIQCVHIQFKLKYNVIEMNSPRPQNKISESESE